MSAIYIYIYHAGFKCFFPRNCHVTRTINPPRAFCLFSQRESFFSLLPLLLLIMLLASSSSTNEKQPNDQTSIDRTNPLSSSDDMTTTTLDALPPEILLQVFAKLDYLTLRISVRAVCARFCRIIDEASAHVRQGPLGDALFHGSLTEHRKAFLPPPRQTPAEPHPSRTLADIMKSGLIQQRSLLTIALKAPTVTVHPCFSRMFVRYTAGVSSSSRNFHHLCAQDLPVTTQNIGFLSPFRPSSPSPAPSLYRSRDFIPLPSTTLANENATSPASDYISFRVTFWIKDEQEGFEYSGFVDQRETQQAITVLQLLDAIDVAMADDEKYDYPLTRTIPCLFPIKGKMFTSVAVSIGKLEDDGGDVDFGMKVQFIVRREDLRFSIEDETWYQGNRSVETVSFW